MLSIREAAEHLGVSAKTIRRYIADGRIEAVRIGPRLIRVREQSLAVLSNPI